MELDFEKVINVINLVQMEVWVEVNSSFYCIINTFLFLTNQIKNIHFLGSFPILLVFKLSPNDF